MRFLGFEIQEFSPTDGREVDVLDDGKLVWITFSIFFPMLRAKLFCLRNFWRADSLERLT
jgi:hypothetical protein